MTDDYGSPGFTLGELESAPEAARGAADQILASAYELDLRSPDTVRFARDCRHLDPGRTLAVPAGATTLRMTGSVPTVVRLGRFSDATPVELGSLAPGAQARFEIPDDASVVPWRLAVDAPGSVVVCSAV